MEWVETTGPSVEAALDAALDELGVDEDEVEFEVLAEAKSGLFGRIGGNPARIRARVKPISREKPGERNRNRGSRPGRRPGGGRGGSGAGSGGRGGSGSGGRGGSGSSGGKGRSDTPKLAPRPDADADGGEVDPEDTAAPTAGGGSENGAGQATGSGNKRRRRSRGRSGSGGGQRPQEESDVTTTTEDVPIGEQADVADEFMRGLIAAFGVSAEVSVRIEEDVVLVDVEGDDLGLLVGPKGATLRSIEDLVRTVVQRRTDGHGARIHVDVGGYQAKRRAALEKFATDLAGRVLTSGEELALEPMPAADRKVVHDTIAEIDGVVTISEGEEPRRRVVLRPA
jgi:spoIIIJ-associated protein